MGDMAVVLETNANDASSLFTRARFLIERACELRDSETQKIAPLLLEARTLLCGESEGADPLTYRVTLGRCHFQLSKCYERQSAYEAAEAEARAGLELLEATLPMAREEADRRLLLNGIADLCSSLGNIADRRADYAMAMEYRRRNLDILTELGERHKRGHALLQNAATYYRLGDFETALSNYYESLTVFQDSDDLQGHGSAWNGIGNVQFSQRDYAGARESYRKAFQVFERYGDPYWQAGLLGNIANVLLHLEDPDGARGCYEQSLMLRESIGDRHGQCFSLNGLAQVYLRLGDADRSLEMSRAAIRLLNEVGDRAMLANAYSGLARAYQETGEEAKEEEALTMGLGLAETVGVRELVYQIHRDLSALYERRGNAVSALYHHKRYHEEKEALFDQERESKMRGLQVRHQVEQAKREADIYRRLNTELEKANARQAELLEQLRRQSELLERQARTDALTGLMNRRYLEVALADAFAQARQRRHPLTVAIADIDHFKRINDRCSHQVGDAVLRTVARLLQQNCRRDDVLARYGGEEFVLVLPDATPEDAARLCDRMRELIAGHDWDALHPDLRVTISFGLCADTGLEDGERMLCCADARLYEAKEEGRNQVRGR
jgi:diguanylate cyclase (GGDEF)-like protein